MKVFNLACAQAHLFEGWFSSEADYQQQLSRGLLECPLCGDAHIERRPSAPRLNLRATHEEEPVTGLSKKAEVPATPPADLSQQQAALLRAVRQLVTDSEDVGERFVAEARAMHQGDAQARSIRGQATVAEAVELLEDGIDILPLPNLPALKHTLQ